MKKQLIIYLFVLLAATILQPGESAATEPFAKVSTYVFQFLATPTSAHNYALGQMGAADDSDPTNNYYNPAVLSTFEGIGVFYGEMNWFVDADFDDYGVFAGRAFSVGSDNRFRISGLLRNTDLKLDNQVERTVFLPEGTGRSFDPRDRNVTLSLAGAWITEKIEAGAGISTKRLSTSLADSKIRGWGFDLGVFAKAKLERNSNIRMYPSLGLSVLNLGDVDYNGRTGKLPRQYRAGAGFSIEAQRLFFAQRDVSLVSASATVEYVNNDHNDSERTGAAIQLGFFDTAYFRVGVMDLFENSPFDAATRGAGLAWSYRMIRLTLDYAFYEPDSDFDFYYHEVEPYTASLTYSF